jgi:hypothetical protein
VLLDRSAAAAVDFPLRGEWCAITTPAERVPSHGTDYFGQRYAYDFVRLDPTRMRYSPRGLLWQFAAAQPASAFYAWAQPVRSAFPGVVIATGDGWPDRRRVNALWELLRATVSPPRPSPDDYRPLAGNFVMVEGDPGVALYAHLRCGSVRVRVGQSVAPGDPLGDVGNSGNSTMPHLHFHLMDRPDPYTAAGKLCVFRRYERRDESEGRWLPVVDGVPEPLERIRTV